MKKNLIIIFFILLSAPLALAHAQTNNGTVATPTNNGTVSNPTNNGTVSTPTNNGTVSNSSGTLTNPLNASSLQALLQEILGYVTTIGGIFLVLMLVFVGFQFVMAQGNSEKVIAARNTLLWTAVGGLLLLGANAIAIVITSTVSSL